MLQANSAKTIYEELVLTDIFQRAAVYCLIYIKRYRRWIYFYEVDPLLCDDAAGTIEEGLDYTLY